MPKNICNRFVVSGATFCTEMDINIFGLLLPTEWPTFPIVHQLLDALGYRLPRIDAFQIPSRGKLAYAASDKRRSLRPVLLYDLLRACPYLPIR